MTARGTVLIVDDEREMRLLLEDELLDAGYEVVSAVSAGEALNRAATGAVDVVVTDLIMPGMKGDELLRELHTRQPDVPVVIMTAFGSIESAVEATKAGAYHYVAKPFRMEQLLVTVENALRERRLRRELLELRTSLGNGRHSMIAEGPSMRRAIDMVLRAAHVDTPVLLLGESGTGKELLARALHAEGPRRARRFVAVNCSSIPETLLESQLFGHWRGAFTDSREDRAGLFREADGGTILLDEVGDMTPALQGKLLRVLQEREIHPLGAPSPVSVDVRIVAATHRNLEELCDSGAFRRDLYYRLNVISVRVPPLRERQEDILPLVAHFLDKHGRRLDREGCTVAVGALDAIQRYPWPGNVRELENVIERALVLGREPVITRSDLPEPLRQVGRALSPGAVPVRSLADVERDQIANALQLVQGNKAAAARALGIDRKTLYRKLDAYGISD